MDRLKKIIWLAAAVVYLATASSASAVERTISLVGPIGMIKPGQTLMIDVDLTNLTEAINALDLTITFPPDRLQVQSVSREQSALTLWPEIPSWDNERGTIHVVGGLPNGLFAQNARIVTLVMTASQGGSAAVALDDATSAAFLNDGRGTRVALPPTESAVDVLSEFVPSIAITSTSHPVEQQWSSNSTVVLDWLAEPKTVYSYNFGNDPLAVPDDIPDEARGPLTYAGLADGRYSFTIKSRPEGGSWSPVNQRWFLVDSTPPETFTIEHPDPSTVDNQQLVAWSTVDLTSGISHATVVVDGRDEGAVTSPLRLKSDWLGRMVTIAVFDQAGNQRTVDWIYPGLPSRSSIPWIAGGGLLVVLAGLAAWLKNRRR